MNLKAYESLKPESRQLLDSFSVRPFTLWYCGWVDRSTEEDLDYLIRNNGVEIINLPQEERERWAAQTRPMLDRWKERAAGNGVQDPERILEQILEYASRYNDKEIQATAIQEYKDLFGDLYMEFRAN